MHQFVFDIESNAKKNIFEQTLSTSSFSSYPVFYVFNFTFGKLRIRKSFILKLTVTIHETGKKRLQSKWAQKSSDFKIIKKSKSTLKSIASTTVTHTTRHSSKASIRHLSHWLHVRSFVYKREKTLEHQNQV